MYSDKKTSKDGIALGALPRQITNKNWRGSTDFGYGTNRTNYSETLCRLCGMGEENVGHIFDCEALANRRYKGFGFQTLIGRYSE